MRDICLLLPAGLVFGILTGCQTLSDVESTITTTAQTLQRSIFGDNQHSETSNAQPVVTPDVQKQSSAAKEQPTTNAAVSSTAFGRVQANSVIDGDTLELNGRRIRLFGIDAPETAQQCTVRGKKIPCGVVSRNALIGFTTGERVRCIRKDVDRYGRDVSHCFVGKFDLSAAMVRSGHAVAYRQYSRQFVPDEQYAMKNRRGMWKGAFIKPWDWRARRRS